MLRKVFAAAAGRKKQVAALEILQVTFRATNL